MTPAPASRHAAQLAAQIRQQLVTLATGAMNSVLEPVQERLTALMSEAAPSREMQLRRDAWMAYQRCRHAWRDGAIQAWQKALLPEERKAQLPGSSVLALVGTEVVENKIIASRLALNLMEKSAQEVNDLRKRLKFLGGEQDLSARDIAHPEVLLQALVEQWEASGLSRESWQLVNGVVQRHFNDKLQQAYAQCNSELVAQNVMPVMELSPRFPATGSSSAAGVLHEAARAVSAPEAGAMAATGDLAGTRFNRRTDAHGGGTGDLPEQHSQLPSYARSAGVGGGVERRSPERRSGARAQGLLEQVGRLLGGFFRADAPVAAYQAPSAPLMNALAQQPRLDTANLNLSSGTGQVVVIERVVQELRQQSTELKQQAQTDNEKAIIELVALMFQSILQEDRIPTGVRVWFARLQMPVLRVALAEPDFFNKLDHPARRLIDHMGSCVLGFDASGISSTALETEVKRVVQVIEQYPDTGDRVYTKVYEEFQDFLKQHLTEKPATQRVTGIAQQLEQRETLTIQYTIDLRDQLKDMPVRDEVREFLYKVWAEVLAVSAVRHGAQHDETLRLKKTASELIWAASAKPNRTDRARVIATLPALMQNLRSGMTLMGVIPSGQDAHIKIISDTLADAFMSKTQAIDDAQIQALASHLAHLEDFINDDDIEDLPLDAQTIEDLLGIDASDLDVITGAGGNSTPVMLEWVRELALGSWYTLDHNSKIAQVQYAWRSPLQHLHLFASGVGGSYLFQSNRLAGYLQKGLLVPQEEESLLARATRDALGKISANPERLLR
jgi:hypothetical protein